MEIDVKREPKIPSITRPGTFFTDRLNEGKFDDLVGIPSGSVETDYFTFALGTWEQINRQERKLKIVNLTEVEFVSLTVPDVEPPGKPESPPAGYVENTEEEAIALGDNKPPSDSRDFIAVDTGEQGKPYENFLEPRHSGFIGAQFTENGLENYRIPENYSARKYGDRGLYFYVELHGDNGWQAFPVNGYVQDELSDPGNAEIGEAVRQNEPSISNNDRIGYVVGGFNQKGIGFNKKLKEKHFHFHGKKDQPSGLKNTEPWFQLNNPKGYWKVKDIDINEEELSTGQAFVAGGKKFFTFIRNIGGSIVSYFSGESNSGDSRESEYAQYGARDKWINYTWEPCLHDYNEFNKVGTPSDDGQWIWIETANGEFDWSSTQPLIADKTELLKPDNIFIGVPIVSDLEPNLYAQEMDTIFYSSNQTVPLYYPRSDEKYAKTTPPCKVFFGVDFLQRDLRRSNIFNAETSFSDNQFKFFVLEWGDEEELMDENDILKSEFFALYDMEQDTFDRPLIKRLMQMLRLAKPLSDSNGKLSFYEHTYTTPGVKKIKTVVFRINNTGTYLLQTILLNTNIVINDPGEKLQKFNIFGGADFNILPLSEEKNELVIGAIDKKSNYIESLSQIQKDNRFDKDEFLEKNYTEQFLPMVESSSYGDYPGKLDLSTTRIFNKPYDIYHFLGINAEDTNFEIPNSDDVKLPANSMATNILIDDKESIFELNFPNQKDVENIGKSQIKPILIGDYELEKEDKQPLRKKDNMNVPNIEKSTDRQAF